MALPAAKKDISANPASNAVSSPVNREQKDADVHRKIRLYGVVEAFRQGRMPDNSQIDRFLQYFRDAHPVDKTQLSPDGQRLIQDTNDVIETARLIVQDKNADELLQNFIWHTRDVDLDRARKDPNEILPVDKEKAQNDGTQAVTHLRTLLHLVLTNSEARKLLSDFSLIGRDLLSKGASKAAQGVAPDAERLRQVDDSGPKDQFITEGGRQAGPNETPVFEAKVPDPRPGREGEVGIKQHPRDQLGQGTKVKVGDEEKTGDQAYEQGVNRAQELGGRGQDRVQRETEDIENQIGGLPADTEDAREKQTGLVDRMKGMRDNVFDRVPQQHKDRANEHFERGRKFLSEEYFPEERRDQFIFRGKKVIIECQRHKDYEESIRWLIGYIEEYAKHGKTVTEHGKDSHREITGDSGLQTATRELRTLLERFANGKSMDGIVNAINALIEAARSDLALREWFKSVDAYARKILLQPGFVLEPQCNTEGNRIKDDGRRFYDAEYKHHFDNLFNSISDWFRAMGDDPFNKRFGNDWARLTKDLLFDNEGSLKYKPELWADIRKVFLPALVDQVGYVPIPRIEYTDKELDLVIEDLTLQGRNIFPNYVNVESHNFLKFSPYDAVKDENHHEITLTLGHIQADMRDVAFFFRKKTGIPKLTDSGLADVLLGGSGMTATVHLASATKDQSSVFHVKDVNVKIDTLKFSIRDSKHDMLYKTLKPLATGLVKKQIQKAVTDALTTGLEYVDGQLVGVRDRIKEANARDDDKDRTKVLQELFHSKKDEASSVASKAESKKSERGSQFKVVNKRDSVLLPEGHPSGWANKTSEYADAAVSGQDWRSDAFNIV